MGKIINLLFSMIFNVSPVFSLLKSYKYSITMIQSVHVYDKVIDTTYITKAIDTVACADGSLGHCCFTRYTSVPNCPPVKNLPRTPIESIIDTLLEELGDDSDIVEYWFRDEWVNLEAHRDVDEKFTQVEDGVFRFPRNAHVLYLHVGEEVHGPTLVWHDKNDFNLSEDDFKFHPKNCDKMVVVPAVEGRLLRFSGNMLHSVPRPTFAYLDDEEGGTNWKIFTRTGRKGFENYNPMNDSNYESISERRSVLLFNTWLSSAGGGPLNIPLSPPENALKTWGSSLKTHPIPENLKPFFKNNNPVSHKKQNWVESDILNQAETNFGEEKEKRLIRMKVGLLGDKLRRVESERFFNFFVPSSVKTALKQSYQPTVVPLSINC